MFHEHERRLAAGLARESAEGRSTLAIALRDALQLARDQQPSTGECPLRTLEEAHVTLLVAIERAVDPSAIATGRIHALGTLEGDTVQLAIGGQIVVAGVDPSVHPAVLRGAFERGERVLAERDERGAWIILGALRTQPTPGIDAASAYTIEADTITIRGRSEVSIVTEAAGLVVRALGEVETYADEIISRAEGVHKIVGRILRLN